MQNVMVFHEAKGKSMKRNLKFLSAAFLATVASATALADSARVTYPGNGHDYQRFDTALTWSNARTDCAGRGGNLATLTSAQESDWVFQNVGLQGTDTWLGGTDEGTEGIWQWVTGEPWAYTNWFPGNPDDNAGGGQDYLAFTSFDTLGRWDDAGLPSEDLSRAYICEWNPTGPQGASAIPTLSEWGIILASCLLGLAGVFVLRRKYA